MSGIRGRYSRSDQPEPSHTANTDDDEMSLEKRLKVFQSPSGDQTETHSFLTSATSLLSSTEPYSITANEKDAIKEYLDKSKVKVNFLKVRLIDLLLRNMYDATEQPQFSVDHKNVLTVYNLFNDQEKKGLYSYDLKDFEYNTKSKYKEINDIVYKLKFINIIYLILQNNSSQGETLKEYKEHTFKYKDKFTELRINSRIVKMEEFKRVYPSWREKNPLSNQERSLAKRDENTSPVLNLEQQPETDIVSDTNEFNRIRNILQEFIRIYNYLIPKNYKLKEQNGDKFEQLQYETKLTMLLTPAFGKDRRWFDKWDKENDKGDITNNMSNILTSINDIIINLNDKKKIGDTTYINVQLTKLNIFIIEAKSYIKAEKYEEVKRDIIKKNKEDYIKVKYLIINFVETYNKTFTADTISQEENETTITELKYKISIQGRDSKYTKPINYINEKIKALQIIKDKPTEVKGKDFQDALKNLEGSITSAKDRLFLSGGNPPTKYKSTGITVYILYEKKKYKRTVYTKDNRKTKYCKINNKYILLSKLNVIE